MITTKESLYKELREDLRFNGYTVIEQTVHCSAQYVMAVKRTRLLFLRARRFRRKIIKPEVVALHFAEEIEALARISFQDCQRQLWIYAEDGGWTRYTVHPDETISEVQQWATR